MVAPEPGPVAGPVSKTGESPIASGHDPTQTEAPARSNGEDWIGEHLYILIFILPVVAFFFASWKALLYMLMQRSTDKIASVAREYFETVREPR